MTDRARLRLRMTSQEDGESDGELDHREVRAGGDVDVVGGTETIEDTMSASPKDSHHIQNVSRPATRDLELPFFFSVYARIVPGAERATSKEMARSIVAVAYRRANPVCSTSHRAARN